MRNAGPAGVFAILVPRFHACQDSVFTGLARGALGARFPVGAGYRFRQLEARDEIADLRFVPFCGIVKVKKNLRTNFGQFRLDSLARLR